MLPNITEAEAIERFKSGDKSCFELIYSLHKRRVYSLCLRMAGDAPTAEDLTQETFLLVFRKLKTFRGDSAFTTWLHRITVNVVLMHIRYNKRHGPDLSLEELDTYEDSPKDTLGTPDPVLNHSVDRVALDRAISQLPPGYRLILVLHDIEGYEHQEIAGLLGCTMGNTKSQLHKARLKLRKLLAEGAGQRENATSPAEPLSGHPQRPRMALYPHLLRNAA
ncbi:MAG: RNA polymerase sigma factor [Terriglobales bacterium]